MGEGVSVGAVGIGQSFLVSNKFSEADPVLGQGVPCLTGVLGMFSSSGGWSFEWKDVPHSGVLLLGKGFQQIFPLPTCIQLLV